MLRQRVISGAIAACLVVFGVFALPNQWFTVIAAVLLAVPGWEWAGLTGVEKPRSRTLFALTVLASMAACWWLEARISGIYRLLIWAGLLFWCAALVRILRYSKNPVSVGDPRIALLTGFLVVLPCWAALVELHRFPEAGPALVMVLLSLVWAADTGAYFAGRRWGRRKLAPKVSPGKTVEGLFGGLALGLLVSGGAGLLLGVTQWSSFLFVCGSTLGFAVAGDLYESMIKRQGRVKDSGNLLPGHGGALDRLDSLTAAAPMFTLGIVWLLGNPN